jgi:hypothetical protein
MQKCTVWSVPHTSPSPSIHQTICDKHVSLSSSVNVSDIRTKSSIANVPGPINKDKLPLVIAGRCGSFSGTLLASARTFGTYFRYVFAALSEAGLAQQIYFLGFPAFSCPSLVSRASLCLWSICELRCPSQLWFRLSPCSASSVYLAYSTCPSCLMMG